jgi:transcriptional regulator with XRE-family HTH domain
VPTNADLGQAIRRLRRDRRLSSETLAFAAGIHPTYVSGIKRGVCNPTWAARREEENPTSYRPGRGSSHTV